MQTKTVMLSPTAVPPTIPEESFEEEEEEEGKQVNEGDTARGRDESWKSRQEVRL